MQIKDTGRTMDTIVVMVCRQLVSELQKNWNWEPKFELPIYTVVSLDLVVDNMCKKVKNWRWFLSQFSFSLFLDGGNLDSRVFNCCQEVVLRFS
jgi:hypothetical protein